REFRYWRLDELLFGRLRAGDGVEVIGRNLAGTIGRVSPERRHRRNQVAAGGIADGVFRELRANLDRTGALIAARHRPGRVTGADQVSGLHAAGARGQRVGNAVGAAIVGTGEGRRAAVAELEAGAAGSRAAQPDMKALRHLHDANRKVGDAGRVLRRCKRQLRDQIDRLPRTGWWRARRVHAKVIESIDRSAAVTVAVAGRVQLQLERQIGGAPGTQR